MVTENNKLLLKGLRGATTCQCNSIEAISTAVQELVKELVTRNSLKPENIVSVTFSVTSDLNACFPAAIARRQKGWEGIALLDCQQMRVDGDLEYCIRLLAHAWLPCDEEAQHIYLHEASLLRPDRK